MISYFHFGQTGFPATPPVTHKRRINRPEEYCGISNTNPNFLPISIETLYYERLKFKKPLKRNLKRII